MRITHYHIKAGFERTAAVIADFHSSPRRSKKEYDKKALQLIGGIKPDIILSPGDIFNHTDNTPVDSEENTGGMRLLLESAKIAPLYLSVGNHEHGISEQNREILEKGGVNVLDNTWIRLKDAVIGGFSSGYLYDREYYEGIQPVPDTSMLSGFSAEKGYKILLCHHPEYWKKYISGRGIDLTISGHAHGGQWGFFGGYGIYAPGQGLFPKYVRGLHHSCHDGVNETLAVSRGMTNTVWIPRFFNPCEIAVLHFCKDTDG